jgi:hypothetical protein
MIRSRRRMWAWRHTRTASTEGIRHAQKMITLKCERRNRYECIGVDENITLKLITEKRGARRVARTYLVQGKGKWCWIFVNVAKII